MDVPGYFAALGRAVSETWTGRGRGVAALPEAAAHALAAVEVPDDLDAVAILRWATAATDLPPQTHDGDTFGEPPLVLHHEEDFYIQVLTWMEGTTSIHQHGFAGAFMVLEGASLHVEHAFALGERLLDDQIVVGELSLVQPEVLRPCDIRLIEPGEDFIHALFHLQRPTVTVVVRNEACDLPYPQYSYLAPGLGWAGVRRDRTWAKRIESVDALLRLDPDGGRRAMQEMVSIQGTPSQAWSLIDRWRSTHFYDDVTADLVDRLTQRVSPLAGILQEAMARDARTRRVLARRGMLTALHQRTFLALLANLPEASAVNAVLGQLFPGNPPADLLLAWAEELSAPALRGVSGLKLAPGRLDLLRAGPAEGRVTEVLAEIRAAWGEPRTLSGLPT